MHVADPALGVGPERAPRQAIDQGQGEDDPLRIVERADLPGRPGDVRRPRRLEQRRQPAGVGDRVVVEQRDPLAARVAQLQQVAAREAAVARALDQRDLGEMPPHEGDRVVGRGVGDDDDLVVSPGLAAQRGQAVGEVGAPVPIDDDDRDERVGDHRGTLPRRRSAAGAEDVGGAAGDRGAPPHLPTTATM